MTLHQQKQQRTLTHRVLFSLCTLLIIGFVAKAETNKFPVPKLLNLERQDTVDALFPGGELEQAKYLSRWINEDKHFKDSIYNRLGSGKVRFTVDETGSLKDFVAIENNIPYITNLAIQSLKAGPIWTPKKINGTPVPSTQQVQLNVSVDRWGRYEISILPAPAINEVQY